MGICVGQRDILREIAERAKERVAAKMLSGEAARIKAAALEMADGASKRDFPFEKALRKRDIALICEVKKASPSKGVIAEEFDYLKIACEYEAAGAAAISVLTEPYYFMGSDVYLREIADNVNVPVLRKDFVVDSHMIYEAKELGAGAVLLICALHSRETLSEYINLADSLGISALVEARSEQEIADAVHAGARVIGVNNRNLRTFGIDTGYSENLRKYVPKDIIYVSESGINTAEDIDRMRIAGADAVLIGESVMRSGDKRAKIAELMGGVKSCE